MDVDIDNEFDGKFLDQFRSMGTTDRDVLISQFQSVLGNSINPELCAFFLDMNNWNLQNAVCSYYDFEQPSSTLPSMSVVADVTIGEGEAVSPNTSFVKSWRIKNSGNDRWPPGCHLRFCSGENFSTIERKMVDPLSPGETHDVSVEMKSPRSSGSYLSLWRLCTPTGIFFGDGMNIHVQVADGGLLSLTQQLSRIGSGNNAVTTVTTGSSSPQAHHSVNPPSSQQQQQQQQHHPHLLTSNSECPPPPNPVATQVPQHPCPALLLQQHQQQQQQQHVQLSQVIAQDSNNSKFHISSLPTNGEEDAEMS